MKSDIIDTWAGFNILESEWNGLLQNSRADTIFLTWEWIKCWVDIYSKNTKPFIITVRTTNNDLVGIAPYYSSTLRLCGIVSYRTLRIISDCSTGSEYPDLIAHKNYEEQSYSLIIKTLSKTSDRWDCIWMPNVSGWSGARERIIKECIKNNFFFHQRCKDFSFIKLPDSIAVFFNQLSKNRRQQLTRQKKKIMQKNVVISSCHSLEELPQYLEALFDLHHLRWSQRGEVGSFRRKTNQPIFYKLMSQKALEKKWLWLVGLKDSGSFKAIQIGYVYENVFHQIQEGYDPDYCPGVGNILRYKIIQMCIEKKIVEYDFLGEMTEHKRRWGAKKRLGYDLFIANNCLKNKILFLKNIWPTGRFLKPVDIAS